MEMEKYNTNSRKSMHPVLIKHTFGSSQMLPRTVFYVSLLKGLGKLKKKKWGIGFASVQVRGEDR